MSDTSTQTPKYIPGQPTVTTTPVGNEPTPVKNVQSNINITATKSEQPTETKPSGKLDVTISNASANYINNFVSQMGRGKQFNTNQNGDEYNLGGVLNAGQDAVSNAFKGQIMRDTKLQSNFQNAQESFSQLDNQNYRYIHNSILGNMRVAIDADGKDIGLPEPVAS